MVRVSAPQRPKAGNPPWPPKSGIQTGPVFWYDAGPARQRSYHGICPAIRPGEALLEIEEPPAFGNGRHPRLHRPFDAGPHGMVVREGRPIEFRVAAPQDEPLTALGDSSSFIGEKKAKFCPQPFQQFQGCRHNKRRMPGPGPRRPALGGRRGVPSRGRREAPPRTGRAPGRPSNSLRYLGPQGCPGRSKRISVPGFRGR